MRKLFIILVAILFITTACRKSDIQGDNFITINVTKSYPKKELILQDFMDVDYIPLETNDDFITTASIQAIGQDIIIIKNFNRNFTTDGDFFIFDKNGKGLRKANRLGQSGHEYTSVVGIALDEENGEIFVNDITTKVVVYDLSWNFKRSFGHEEEIFYKQINNFDQDHLICHVGFNYEDDIKRDRFRIISKQDGSVVKRISIPYKEKKQTSLYLTDINGNTLFDAATLNKELIRYYEGWLLVEPASDTIYKYQPDHTMTPFMVRTPSIQSMSPEVFLFPGVLTDRYYFMQTVKREADLTTKVFPRVDLMYDRKEKAIYEYTVYNDDYTNKNIVKLGFDLMVLSLINEEIAFMRKLEAPDLIEAYEKGQLKGKLKEIAAELDEESNPVLMLGRYKK
ncbi:MAG: 6-bladed beta-propeller [Tannerellaceae bacterium]|nr:6-bladed beta-propeller [Tannerellaceae bacterium]